MVETEVEALQILRAPRCDARDELLRGDPLALGLEHDRCAVRVIRAYEMPLVAQHPLEAHPDVGLDVLHDVPDVKRAIGVGQGGGDENLAGHAGSLPEMLQAAGNPPGGLPRPPVNPPLSAPRTCPC